MKRILFFFTFILYYASSFAQYSINGTVYTYPVSASTGLQTVYIANGLSAVTISYTAASTSSVKWYSYTSAISSKSDVSASDIATTNNGSTITYSITAPEDGTGYLVEVDGNLKPALWMIDYSKHTPTINHITATASSDCSNKSVAISVDKSENLTYYSIAGVIGTVSLYYKIQYNKQSWNDTSESFVSSIYTSDWKTINNKFYVDAPLMDTRFIITGDQIADQLGISQSVSSDTYIEKFTEAHMITKQTAHNSENEIDSVGSNGLGGSAPAEITFKGIGNEPTTAYYEWTIYKKSDLKNWIARYNDQNISYTFSNAGNYIVYLETTNQESTCKDTASVEFSISESFLDLPNYFTPNASEGVNDIYKVSYKSLVSFKATIVNRWGNKIYQWTDPSQGWDGKYNGRYVSPGVYYISVIAKGSDGILYKRGRDINILTTP